METSNYRNRVNKREGVLFTCLVTRAVYLDLAISLPTEDFILVLRRFIRLFGKPRQVLSDNGTNFFGAERGLRKEFEIQQASKVLDTFFQKEAINWQFQVPPRTPHFGGAHEVLVKCAKKRPLGKSLRFGSRKPKLALPNRRGCMNCPFRSRLLA